VDKNNNPILIDDNGASIIANRLQIDKQYENALEVAKTQHGYRMTEKPAGNVPDPEEVRTTENYKVMADEILAEAKRRVSTSNTPAQEVDAVREQYDVDMISINNYNPEAYSNLVRELNALKTRATNMVIPTYKKPKGESLFEEQKRLREERGTIFKPRTVPISTVTTPRG